IKLNDKEVRFVEVEIKGTLMIDEEMSHQDFVILLMECLKSKNIHFTGSTKQVEVHYTYNKK
ncbi:hypothetical protein CWO92_24605, partial [Heyndrickxia camelliae]